MTKVIVSATHKGGEGKTTNSIILAEYLTLIAKRKILVIDMDPQANLSGRYVKMEYDPTYKGGKIPPIHPDFEPDVDMNWDGRSSIADIFFGKEIIPYPTFIPNLELLPAYSAKLQEAELVTKQDVVKKVHERLREFLRLPEVHANYDAILVDTPPSKGPLTIASIKAATHIIIPAQMEQFSIEGIYGMLQLWKQETFSRAKDDPVELVGILPNKVRKIKLHKNFLEGLREIQGVGPHVMPYHIKNLARYSEILVENASPKSIFELESDDPARTDYEMVCKYIDERIFNHGKT